jgi:hypothetical protein
MVDQGGVGAVVADASVRRHSCFSLSGTVGVNNNDHGTARVTPKWHEAAPAAAVMAPAVMMPQSRTSSTAAVSQRSASTSLKASGTATAGAFSFDTSPEIITESHARINACARDIQEGSANSMDETMHLKQQVEIVGSLSLRLSSEQPPAAGFLHRSAAGAPVTDADVVLGVEVPQSNTLQSSEPAAGGLLAGSTTPGLPAAAVAAAAAATLPPRCVTATGCCQETGLQDSSAVIMTTPPGTMQAATSHHIAHRRLVHVSAHEAGTFAFKGCGAMDMACLMSEELLVLPHVAHSVMRPQRGAKGGLGGLEGLGGGRGVTLY